MVSVWILSPHNLHCPRCETRLIERAGRFEGVPGRRGPVHVGEVGTLSCRQGHLLPSREELYAHREQRGHPRTAAVREVLPPEGAPATGPAASPVGSRLDR
jgi:hypothetical protein